MPFRVSGGSKKLERGLRMSSNDIAIRISNLTKCYHIYDRPQNRLKQYVIPKLQCLVGSQPKNYFREFWALREVSFEVKKGETIGIIGQNGSGKSTLLQLICGTLSPTSGSVETHGRIAALLELGSGFNPEFTGRENVYMNGAVLGLSNEEINARFADIATFADIGEFIDQPVKTYSSGMFARLAFAVAVHVDPQILVVDEALSVGDGWFQHKSMARMRKLMEGGTTVLFVSHSIDAVRSLCQRAVWLENGVVKMLGDANDITNRYMNDVFIEHNRLVMASLDEKSHSDIESPEMDPALEQSVTDQDAPPTANLDNHNIVTVREVSVLNSQGFATEKIEQGELFSIAISLSVNSAIRDLSVGILIKDQFGLELTGESVFNKQRIGMNCRAGQQVTVTFKSRMILRGGQSYSVAVRLNKVAKWDRSDNILLFCNETAAVFDVVSDPDDPMWFKFKQDFEVDIHG